MFHSSSVARGNGNHSAKIQTRATNSRLISCSAGFKSSNSCVAAPRHSFATAAWSLLEGIFNSRVFVFGVHAPLPQSIGRPRRCLAVRKQLHRALEDIKRRRILGLPVVCFKFPMELPQVCWRPDYSLSRRPPNSPVGFPGGSPERCPEFS